MKQPIFIGTVAGLSHSKPDFTLLAPTQQVHLAHEAANEYDARAIRVTHPAAGKLGYLPRESTEAIHTAWSNGFEVHAAISSIDPGLRYSKVIICVYINCQPIS